MLPRASNAGLQSPIWTRLRCYVFFYWSKVRWRTKNDKNVDFPSPTLSQTSKRVLHEGNISGITWTEDIGKEILYPLGFPNTKFKERWSKSWKWKNRKDSYAAWITYLLFSKWFRSFLQIIGRAHPHNSWNNKHKRPRNATLGGQTDLISAFRSIYFEHHSHNFYNRNPLILKL